MAVQGSYRINYTDPKNGSFIIEPYTINGNVTPTSDILHSKATRVDTSLLLPGQYVPNYGELILESLVHLAENFSGDTAPVKPNEGQLWYDTGDSYSIIDLSPNGCTLAGNHSAQFSGYVASGTPLTAWYGPVSVTDNSYNSVEFKATSALITSDNNTVITIAAITNGSTALPNNAVGGFVTLSQSSRIGRLKVAVKVNNALTWSDVVNVNCSLTPPITESLQTGDLWYDISTSQLKLFINNSWTSLTGGYLPLTGGVLTGALDMGTNPIYYGGPVSIGSTLTPKWYVDQAIIDAIAPLQNGSNAAIQGLTTRVVALETAVPGKVSKAGDSIQGALVFGPAGSTTSIPSGIDMGNRPVINPLITWSSTDYLNASGEKHYTVDKNYVALALKQHLQDAVHGGKTFIQEDVDGTGTIVESLHFSDLSKTLSFNVNNTSYGLGVSPNSLVIYTGALLGSKITFKQTGSSANLFELGDSAHRSYKSMYMFDGQPQPTFGGAVTAENEDTKLATKGYVLNAVTIAQNGAIPITSASFNYQLETGPFSLNLVRPGAPTITVDINHGHLSEKIQHRYTQLVRWQGGSVDLVGQSIGNAARVTTERMLDALNQYKAPTSGAKFIDAPVIGSDDSVVSIQDTNHSFALQQTPGSAIAVGQEITMAYPDQQLNPDTGLMVPVLVTINYTIATKYTVPDPAGGPDIFRYTTSPVLVSGHDLVAKPMTCRIPVIDAGNDVRNAVNMASLRNQIQTSMTAYVPTYVSTYVTDYVANTVPPMINADRYKTVTTQSGTSYSLAIGAKNQYIRFTNNAAITFSIPQSTAWTIGDEVELRQAGDGLITLNPASGVTLNLPPDALSTTRTKGKGATLRLKNVAVNEWDVWGDMQE